MGKGNEAHGVKYGGYCKQPGIPLSQSVYYDHVTLPLLGSHQTLTGNWGLQLFLQISLKKMPLQAATIQ